MRRSAQCTLGTRPASGNIVDVSGVSELRGIDINRDYVRIGGATTWSELVAAPLPRCFNALRAAAREIGAIQIQNRGTIAGNLCNASPAADGVPPLLILDAELELTSASTTRRLRLEDFIIGNRKTERRADEILSAVIVPLTLSDAPSVFVKLGARRYLVISISMVAALVCADRAGRAAAVRVSVGSCSVSAKRLRELEFDLVGESLVDLPSRVRAEHLRLLSPIDDVRATGAYRLDATHTLVRRALDACTGAK